MAYSSALLGYDLELYGDSLLVASPCAATPSGSTRPSRYSAVDLNQVLGFGQDDELHFGGKGYLKHVHTASWKTPYLTVYKTVDKAADCLDNPSMVRRQINLLQHLDIENGKLVCRQPAANREGRYAAQDQSHSISLGAEHGVPQNDIQNQQGSTLRDQERLPTSLPRQAISKTELGEKCVQRRVHWKSKSLDSQPSQSIRRKPCPAITEAASETGNEHLHKARSLFSSWELKYRHARLEYSELVKVAHYELKSISENFVIPGTRAAATAEQPAGAPTTSERCDDELLWLMLHQFNYISTRGWEKTGELNRLRKLCLVQAVATIWNTSTYGYQIWAFLEGWVSFFVPLIAAKDPFSATILNMLFSAVKDIWLCDASDEVRFQIEQCVSDVEHLRWLRQSARRPPVPRDLASFEVARQLRDYLMTSEASIHSFRNAGELYLEFHRGSDVEVVTVQGMREEFMARNAGREETLPGQEAPAEVEDWPKAASGSDSLPTAVDSPTTNSAVLEKSFAASATVASDLEVSTLSEEWDESKARRMLKIWHFLKRFPCFDLRRR